MEKVSSQEMTEMSWVKRDCVERNKAGYTATLVACGWAGAVLEKVTKTFGQEQ